MDLEPAPKGALYAGMWGHAQVRVPVGVHTFELSDAGRNGICCQAGQGNYTIHIDSTPAVQGNGIFMDSVRHSLTCGVVSRGLFDGAQSCDGVLTAKPNYCGCYYQSGMPIDENSDRYTLGTTVPKDVITRARAAVPLLINQGCCSADTLTRETLELGMEDWWGLCGNEAP
eukprot:NODE_4727_length_749_cov_43.237942_g4567_i0.p1 GENE.NODE_4727_length_749_cov_43.237942_g4567_i0~~NODE_4727_length_749_cov_43.237942_g4567_i0.p1  ORF type:complete len:171 (+),score=23.31 NODE_4727_length_749_cov_43.237942_g4567_i0:166-678(+)